MRMLPAVMAGLSGLTFKGHGQHQNVGGVAGGAVFHAGNIGLRAGSSLNGSGSLLGAFFVAGADDHSFSRAGPAQSESHARGSSASDDSDGADCCTRIGAHANSASSACSAVHSSSIGGCLMWMRE